MHQPKHRMSWCEYGIFLWKFKFKSKHKSLNVTHNGWLFSFSLKIFPKMVQNRGGGSIINNSFFPNDEVTDRFTEKLGNPRRIVGFSWNISGGMEFRFSALRQQVGRTLWIDEWRSIPRTIQMQGLPGTVYRNGRNHVRGFTYPDAEMVCSNKQRQ